MIAGTYTLVAMSCDSNCYDTLIVTITEPLAIALFSAVGNESTPGAKDGQIDLTVSGGTQCSTSDAVCASSHVSYYTSTMTRGYYFQAQSSYSISNHPPTH
jgi:hypothetical protein